MINSATDSNVRVESATSRDEEFNTSLIRAIQESSPDGILVVDKDSVVVSYNRRFLELWRIPYERIRPDDGDDGLMTNQPILLTVMQRVKNPVQFIQRVQALYGDYNARDYCEIELKDGRTLERHSAGLRNDRGEYLGRVWFFRDITRHKQAEAELKELASRDPLTGVMNRGYFFQRATEELNRARRFNHPLAALMIDLDHFKYINDHFGHAAGDQVLKTVCERCDDVLRNIDVFGRLGGEEFSVLMPESGLPAARAVAERLRAVVASQAVAVQGRTIRCTISAGVSLARSNDNSVEDALRRADDALYCAKRGGRNRVEVN